MLATSIRGRKNKEAREAARETVKTKYRKARSDELGATTALRVAKVATLSQLIGRSNVWDGKVLSKPVRALHAPALVDPKLRPAIPLAEVRPKQRELSTFESYYTSRVITSGREQREKVAALLNGAVLRELGLDPACALERLLRQLVATHAAIRDANHGCGEGFRLLGEAAARPVASTPAID